MTNRSLKMKKIRAKISKGCCTMYLYYPEVLTVLCLDNGLHFVAFCKPVKDRGRWGFTHMNHYICVYNVGDETPPGKQFVEDESHGKYLIYRTNMYGNVINAYGDAIRWIERNFK